MTAFLIVCIFLFLLSIFSNAVFILNNYTEVKLGAVLGLLVFSGMVVWALTLLLQFHAAIAQFGFGTSLINWESWVQIPLAVLIQWWYNFNMENVFDQDLAPEDMRATIVEEIIEQPVTDNVSAEDFTVADESDIDWSTL